MGAARGAGTAGRAGASRGGGASQSRLRMSRGNTPRRRAMKRR